MVRHNPYMHPSKYFDAMGKFQAAGTLSESSTPLITRRCGFWRPMCTPTPDSRTTQSVALPELAQELAKFGSVLFSHQTIAHKHCAGIPGQASLKVAPKESVRRLCWCTRQALPT
jgi:hypothetical protein